MALSSFTFFKPCFFSLACLLMRIQRSRDWEHTEKGNMAGTKIYKSKTFQEDADNGNAALSSDGNHGLHACFSFCFSPLDKPAVICHTAFATCGETDGGGERLRRRGGREAFLSSCIFIHAHPDLFIIHAIFNLFDGPVCASLSHDVRARECEVGYNIGRSIPSVRRISSLVSS